MTPHYFILGLFALAGIISLLASLLNWGWFFTAHNAQAVVRRIGRIDWDGLLFPPFSWNYD